MDVKNDTHVSSASQYPLLSKDEELSLARTMFDGREEKSHNYIAAREKLILSNQRLVLKMAFKYSWKTSIPEMDLVQAGMLGLINAIDNFDLSYGTRLSTFATRRILKKILDTISGAGLIHIPSNVYSDICKVNNKESDELTDQQLNRANLAKNMSMVSLDAVVGGGSGNFTKGMTYSECIMDPNSVNPYHSTETHDRMARIYAEMEKLTPMEKTVISDRFLNEEVVCLKEIGDKLGISGERVRQIERKALKKMKFRINKSHKFNV